MAEMSNNALIVFLKNPLEGKVKTRLAAQVGETEALSVYQKLIEHTRSIVMDCPVDIHLFYSDYIDSQDKWLDTEITKHQQEGKDLGERMKNAFKQVLDSGYKNAIIIGTDCPEITSRIIQDAFDRLEEYDVVIGPAMDGGYYLLGMNDLHDELFEQIDWGTESVFDQTLAVLQRLGLIWYETPILSDIDTEDDLPKLRNISGRAQISQ